MSGVCCVVDCDSHFSEQEDVELYDFPNKVFEKELRKRWIEAIKIANSEKPSWEPNTTCKVCSEHFLGNYRSLDPSDPNSVPTIFPIAKPTIPKHEPEVCIDVEDSDDCDSEVIEETSDCLFVVEKIKEEYFPEPSKSSKSTHTRVTNQQQIWRPKAAKKRKISRSSAAEKNTISSMRRKNVISSSKRNKEHLKSNKINSPKPDPSKDLFTGKFSSDSSDFALDDECFRKLDHDEEYEVSEDKLLSIPDKIKIALRTPTGRFLGDSDSDSEYFSLPSDKEKRQKKKGIRRKRNVVKFPSKSSQATLPGLCDGFVFCTIRDDDYNVGVQCNILYELTLISSCENYSDPKNVESIITNSV